MKKEPLDSFQTRKTLKVGKKKFTYFNLAELEKKDLPVARLPTSLKILLENLLRHEDGKTVTTADIENLARWDPKKQGDKEISFMPARVILQDFTGVPCIADLAAMRDAMEALGGDPKKINPLIPCELVIDHSVQVDSFGNRKSFAINAEMEFQRNRERYQFLRWGQAAFDNFKVVPPDTGIVHQVNLEYLARVVCSSPSPPWGEGQGEGEPPLAYPDTVVGTDSHTTMINGLGVLGWGVGGIEAEAAMLGQPFSLVIPEVLGVKLTGRLPTGATATDLVLTITEKLRKKGVVGKFVEFFGPGIAELSLADRATIGNMAPEYGCTCALFPIDAETVDYLKFTGRKKEQVDLVAAYAKAQGFFRTKNSPDPEFSDILEFDLASTVPCLAGPKRPQDRVPLKESKKMFAEALKTFPGQASPSPLPSPQRGEGIGHGSVVIAAITSCTNTSNPSVLIGAGLLAKKAAEKGLMVKPWVKTSLAPGSKVVTAYLKEAGLLAALESQKFHLVGYGCTTCIGNSGPLAEEVRKEIREKNLVAAAVLSGNRNFEARINPDVRANYLASPPLVVAYALSGTMNWDPATEPLGHDKKGNEVFLSDIWPTETEIRKTLRRAVKTKMFREQYGRVYSGDKNWKSLPIPKGEQYAWDNDSTYVQSPPYFSGMKMDAEPVADIVGARVLALLGDSVTTDHISPAGSISRETPAARYLIEHGIDPKDFNSYGARRGNHEVMVRGTFANVRLKNLLLPGTEGGITKHFPSGETLPIFDASVRYQNDETPLIVIAGKEYGSGSSRDWAAKGPKLLGVRAVIAESYERIHRSNLVGMGILPLQFLPGENRESLGLTGEEVFAIAGLAKNLGVGKKITVLAARDGKEKSFHTLCRIDTPVEVDYFRHGGILPYVLRQIL